jgi:hypothetical protein
MTEATQVWHVMRDKVAAYGHWERVENAAGSGMPDVNYCVNGVEGWVELKIAERVGSKPPKLTLGQVMWAEERARNRGRAFLLVRYERPQTSWCLYDAVGARCLFDKEEAHPILFTIGDFPTIAILKALTCREF